MVMTLYSQYLDGTAMARTRFRDRQLAIKTTQAVVNY